MFGIIYGLISLVTGAFKSIYDAIESSETKRMTYDNKTHIYFNKSTFIHEPTRKSVFHENETWVDVHGNIIVDEREMKREEMLKKSHPGVTVIRYPCKEETREGWCVIKGLRYQDIETGEVYVPRCFFKMWKYNKDAPLTSIYMSVETGLLIREVDGEYERQLHFNEDLPTYNIDEAKEKVEKEKEKVARWIKSFNEKQLEKGKPDGSDFSKFWDYWANNYLY